MSKEKELNKLKESIAKINLPLKETSTNLVFGKGNPNAEILFIGEAPGAKEDLQGEPFVGSAGKNLDKLLNSINLTIDDVYIANILKYRPPKNRNPNKLEIKSHTPYLIEQIKIIKPKYVCTLGNFSTKFVLAGFDADKMNKIDGITSLHGEISEVKLGTHMIKVFPLFHPAAMLYNPKLREVIEKDFFELQKHL